MSVFLQKVTWWKNEHSIESNTSQKYVAFFLVSISILQSSKCPFSHKYQLGGKMDTGIGFDTTLWLLSNFDSWWAVSSLLWVVKGQTASDSTTNNRGDAFFYCSIYSDWSWIFHCWLGSIKVSRTRRTRHCGAWGRRIGGSVMSWGGAMGLLLVRWRKASKESLKRWGNVILQMVFAWKSSGLTSTSGRCSR